MQDTNSIHVSRRPLGVTILAVFLGIEGFLALLVALLSLGVALSTTPLAFIGVGIGAVIGLLNLALAWGLATIKPWALKATITLQIVATVWTLLLLVTNLPKNTISSTLGNLILPVIVLVYLSVSKKVRGAFRQ